MLPSTSLSAEQKGQITLFVGMWLEDQKQFDDAIGNIIRWRNRASPRHSGRKANGGGVGLLSDRPVSRGR